MRDYTDTDYNRGDDRYHELVDEGRLPLRYGGRHLSALDPLPSVAPPVPPQEEPTADDFLDDEPSGGPPNGE